jgi:DNA (cytosine-5)-methyltransferase 1
MKGIIEGVKPVQLNFLRPFGYTFEVFNFTFVDLFSGIGGFRLALQELGGKCLAYSEINKDSIKVYDKNFVNPSQNDEIYLGDITKIDKLSFEVDIIVGGVPCQAWSVAGKLQGFDDPRGKLWFDVFRVIKLNAPKAFIFENVKGLVDPINRESFDFIIDNLQKLGYSVKAKLINAYDFGLPQNRERVFIVGIRNDCPHHQDFQFPEPLELQPKLYQFISDVKICPDLPKAKIDSRILFGEKIPRSRNGFQKDDELNDFFVFCDTRNGHTTIHSWDIIETTTREKMICHTILKNRRKKKYGDKDGNPLSFEVLGELITHLTQKELDKLIEKQILRDVENQGYQFVNSKMSSGINGIYRVFLPHSDIIPTLTATGTKDYIAKISIEECKDPEEYKQRFLTEIYHKNKFKPLSAPDMANLQGFPNWFTIASKEDIAKKQLGNAVPVPVVYHVAKSLLTLIK